MDTKLPVVNSAVVHSALREVAEVIGNEAEVPGSPCRVSVEVNQLSDGTTEAWFLARVHLNAVYPILLKQEGDPEVFLSMVAEGAKSFASTLHRANAAACSAWTESIDEK